MYWKAIKTIADFYKYPATWLPSEGTPIKTKHPYMTDKEQKVLDLTAEAWNSFLQLPEYNEDDVADFRFHIHAIQNMVLAREGVRATLRKGLNDNKPPEQTVG
jgi:hypothetical protein